MRSITLPLIALLACVCSVTPAAHAKNPWASGLDLEPSLLSAALVMSVRVEDISEVRVVYGGKGTETLYQYTFEPVRVLKGVYSRPQLVMTSADLSGYTSSFDPKDIQRGQQRLLLLGRSRVGYVGMHPGSSADLAFPIVKGRTDPLLSAVEVLLSQQELHDRLEIVTVLSRELRGAKGRGAVVLLAAIERRSYIGAQQATVFQAVGRQLGAESAIVREAASHVLASLLEADYLRNQAVREAAVAALVKSLKQTPSPLAARVAALHTLGGAPEAVRANDDAVHLVSPDLPFDTLAELSARLDLYGLLHENQSIVSGDVVSNLLAELPLDAPHHLQQSASQAWARIAASAGANQLLERIRRKKALGLDSVAEVEAFGLIFPKVADPWPLQRALLETGLTNREQQAFVQACEEKPSPRLVSHLEPMLDPRQPRLRRLTSDLLMKIDTKAAAEAIRPYLSEETDLAYKLRLAAFLGRHGFEDGYDYALEHMSDSRYFEAAVEAVGTIKKSGSADELLDIYRDSNDLGWKRAAVRALGLLGAKSFHDELIILTADQANPLAASAILARADMGDMEVIDLLPAALSSRSDAVAVAAARAAARLLPRQRSQEDRTADAVRTQLATIAQDPGAVHAVRHQALEAMVAAEDPRLEAVLIAMVRDSRIEQTALLTRVRELMRELRVRI